MLQTHAPPVENFWLRHWYKVIGKLAYISGGSLKSIGACLAQLTSVGQCD